MTEAWFAADLLRVNQSFLHDLHDARTSVLAGDPFSYATERCRDQPSLRGLKFIMPGPALYRAGPYGPSLVRHVIGDLRNVDSRDGPYTSTSSIYTLPTG